MRLDQTGGVGGPHSNIKEKEGCLMFYKFYGMLQADEASITPK